MAKSSKDTYANIAAAYVVESAAGTLSYAKFNFPYSVMDKMAILINRVEYLLGSLAELNTSADKVICGLVAATTISDIGAQSDPALLDNVRLTRNDIGTAASGLFVQMPIVKDFSNLPGGGILVAPAPIQAAIQSTGASGVMGAWVRFFYTAVQLSTDEYWELVEARRIITT